MAFLARLEGTQAGGDHAVKARPRSRGPFLWSSQPVAPLGPFHCLSLGRSPYCDPPVKTFFAAELVRAAIPGLVESNRSLGLAALAAFEGLEVADNLQYADTPQLASLMRAARVREGQTEGREGWTDDKKGTADMLYQSIIMRERRTEGPVAAAAAREELEQLNPDLLDKALGSPALPASPGRRVRARGTRRARRGARARGGARRRVLSRF
jgi:hypothetical protein